MPGCVCSLFREEMNGSEIHISKTATLFLQVCVTVRRVNYKFETLQHALIHSV